jgi:Fis family transcriptional regulator
MTLLKTIEEISSREALPNENKSLSDSVRQVLKNYFSQLEGEMPREVYDMLLSEIEMPLLTFLVDYTKNNQVKITKLLGLSRGTARKKLKRYGLLRRGFKK